MPRFDFECQECKKTFEQQLPSGAPAPSCLLCGSTKVEKLLSPPPPIFKGTGFYKTDSRKEASSFAKASEDRKEAKEAKERKEKKETPLPSSTETQKKPPEAPKNS